MQHNLGHVNSVAYCKETDTLICGNGSSDQALAGKIYILPALSTKTQLLYADCVVIDMTSQSWGYKMNVVWGENNNGNFNIAYVITNDNKNVHKILLTKTSGVFDGGYIVLGSYSQEDGIDVNQGSCFYNGKLYCGIGHSQIQIMEMTLNNDGTITKFMYKDVFYDTSGTILTGITNPYTEGVCLKDGYIYVGCSDKFRVYKID
jgi:hypothetical protein